MLYLFGIRQFPTADLSMGDLNLVASSLQIREKLAAYGSCGSPANLSAASRVHELIFVRLPRCPNRSGARQRLWPQSVPDWEIL